MMRIRLSTQKLLSSLRNVHRGPLLSLLLAAGMLFTLMTFTACDCNNDGADDCTGQTVTGKPATETSAEQVHFPQQQPNTVAKMRWGIEGRRHYRVLGVKVTGTPPASVDYTWRPPDGATNFEFSGRQPEPGWDPNDPVFTFRNVPPGETIPVAFSLPTTSPHGRDEVVEALTAQPKGGEATTAYLKTKLGTAAEANWAAPPEKVETSPKAPAALVEMWHIHRWYRREIPITSAQCQQAVNLLQGDAAFVALQIPEPPHAGDESVLLPIYQNALIALEGDNGLSVQGEGTFRPERFTFAANELPQTPGKIWITMGAVTTPKLTCPAGKQTDNWEIHLGFQLDLSYMPNSCEGCTLDFFLCYEGQELPGSRLERYVARQQVNRTLEKLARATAAGAGVQDYRGWGITCAGPLPLQLFNNWARWGLIGASAQAVTRTWPITLPVTLEGNVPNPPQLFDLQFSSNLNAGWRWSDGQQVITPPISYAGGLPQTVAYLVGRVPTDAQAGMYTTQITASLHSQPADSRVAPHLIWVGEWVAPPTGAPSTPSLTLTPSPTATSTPTPTSIATATPTPSPTATATLTPAPTATATPTSSPTATATPTPAPTATATPSPSPTATATLTPAPTATRTATPAVGMAIYLPLVVR